MWHFLQKDQKLHRALCCSLSVCLRLSLHLSYWPDAVLEAGQESRGDAESGVQEMFFLWRLQCPRVCVKLLWEIKIKHLTVTVILQGKSVPTVCFCVAGVPSARVSKWLLKALPSSSSSIPTLPTELLWLRESVSEEQTLHSIIFTIWDNSTHRFWQLTERYILNAPMLTFILTNYSFTNTHAQIINRGHVIDRVVTAFC